MKPTPYPPAQIWLHWIVALLLGVTLALGLYQASLPLSPAKFRFLAWHKWAGVLVLALVLARLALRLLRGAPALPPMSALARRVAHTTHGLLYLLMLALPLTGWLLSSAKGFSVVLFARWPLPDLVGVNAPLADQLALWHPRLAYFLLALAALHVAAALKHQYWDRDGLMSRMRLPRPSRF